MVRAQNPNVKILMRAVELLGLMADDLVFLGGCATGLLITDPAAPPVRVTRDVDVITEVASRSDYYQLGKCLRSRGFVEDVASNVLCRWVSQEVILDVMPIDPDILGFSNRWREFTLNFDGSSFIDVFVGKNGTGKSNLFELKDSSTCISS